MIVPPGPWLARRMTAGPMRSCQPPSQSRELPYVDQVQAVRRSIELFLVVMYLEEVLSSHLVASHPRYPLLSAPDRHRLAIGTH